MVRTWEAARSLVTDPSDPAPALVAGRAALLLAAVTLWTFPSNAVLEPTAGDRRDAHPAAVGRALAFLETNAHLDIGVVDIARAAHVSTRALQLAFRRHLETTPSAALRRVRLDRAHAELRAATPGDGTTVTAVAARWGWARPSRFTSAYRAAYGRTPRLTLGDTGGGGSGLRRLTGRGAAGPGR